MSNSNKKKKQQCVRKRELIRKPLDKNVLDSIDSPNAWTPKIENAWLQELKKISAGEIYRRFPPIKKPPSVRKRGSGSRWGDS